MKLIKKEVPNWRCAGCHYLDENPDCLNRCTAPSLTECCGEETAYIFVEEMPNEA